MQLRRRLKLILALAALVAVVIPMTFAIGPGAFAEDTPTANASVLKVENRKAPRTKVLHKRFRPWARPSTGQVREIIRNEARRWGISAASLANRVACASLFHWWAGNGQYTGVLQFAPGT